MIDTKWKEVEGEWALVNEEEKSDLVEAAEMALEVLDNAIAYSNNELNDMDKARNALRAALDKVNKNKNDS